jgi:hypothetical protein
MEMCMITLPQLAAFAPKQDSSLKRVILQRILMFGLTALPLLAQVAPQPPTISGFLQSPAGVPVSGAQVGILKKAPASIKSGLPVPTAGIAARTTTGPTGHFQFPAKLAGDHILCIQPADFIHLDPCLWGTPQQFTLAAERDRGFGTVILQKGVELRVVVDDPEAILGPADAIAFNPHLTVGYQGPSAIFTPMRVQSISANGTGNTIQYAIAIPPDVDIKVVLIATPSKSPTTRPQPSAPAADPPFPCVPPSPNHFGSSASAWAAYKEPP